MFIPAGLISMLCAPVPERNEPLQDLDNFQELGSDMKLEFLSLAQQIMISSEGMETEIYSRAAPSSVLPG